MHNRIIDPEKLKNCREFFGKTQQELATELGIKSAQTISGWENGRQRVPKKYYNKISTFLNTTIEDLLDKEGVIKRTIDEDNVHRVLEESYELPYDEEFEEGCKMLVHAAIEGFQKKYSDLSEALIKQEVPVELQEIISMWYTLSDQNKAMIHSKMKFTFVNERLKWALDNGFE